LPGVSNADPLDLARGAEISASGAAEGWTAASVVSGPARRTHGNWGPWSAEASNGWAPEELPGWVELSWPEAQALGEIHLTFCSGMERELALSPSARVNQTVIRGPQPETVRDYDLSVDGQTVLEVRGNYQRKRVHALPKGTKGRKLRLTVLATQGSAVAAVYEVRAYGREG